MLKKVITGVISVAAAIGITISASAVCTNPNYVVPNQRTITGIDISAYWYSLTGYWTDVISGSIVEDAISGYSTVVHWAEIRHIANERGLS